MRVTEWTGGIPRQRLSILQILAYPPKFFATLANHTVLRKLDHCPPSIVVAHLHRPRSQFGILFGTIRGLRFSSPARVARVRAISHWESRSHNSRIATTNPAVRFTSEVTAHTNADKDKQP